MNQRNLTSLREPRGFIKLIQIILAIFAFATTTGHRSYFTFQVTCNNSVVKIMKGIFHYPYNLNHFAISLPLCSRGNANDRLSPTFLPGSSSLNRDSDSRVFLEGDYSSAAQFYVAIGVLAFLYALVALVIYVFFDKLYYENERLPMLDFIITMAFALLWLISTSAWAKNVTDLKYYTNPDNMIPRINDCKPYNGVAPCATKYRGDFSSLNVSIIFGYANLILWGGNIWFLYKETNWFKMRNSKSANIPNKPSSIHSPTFNPSAGSRPPPPLFNRTG
ncbi:unnamed protein product [Gordionus sp. m RMFG-2023]